MPQGRPLKPKAQRRNRVAPVRGEWQSSDLIGWQHGSVPRPPTGLTKIAREAWRTWFGAWWAAHWTPEDLPIIRQIIGLYDKVERNDITAAELAQFRQLIDSYGITPKGQQDRRWQKPAADAAPQKQAPPKRPRLKVV